MIRVILIALFIILSVAEASDISQLLCSGENHAIPEMKLKMNQLQAELFHAFDADNFTSITELKRDIEFLEEQLRVALLSATSYLDLKSLPSKSFDVWKVEQFINEHTTTIDLALNCLYIIIQFFGEKGVSTIAFQSIIDRTKLHTNAYAQYFAYTKKGHVHRIRNIIDPYSHSGLHNKVYEILVYPDFNMDPQFSSKCHGIGALHRKWLEYYLTSPRKLIPRVMTTYTNNMHPTDYLNDILLLHNALNVEGVTALSFILSGKTQYASPTALTLYHILLYKLAYLTGFKVFISEQYPLIVRLWESIAPDTYTQSYTHTTATTTTTIPTHNTTMLSTSEGLAMHLKSILNKYSSSSIFNGTSALNHLYTILPYENTKHMYTSNHTTNTSGGDAQWLGEKNGCSHATTGLRWLYIMYVLLIMSSMMCIMFII